MSLLKETYLLWHSFLPHVPRLSRYTLGIKIDNLFSDLIALTLIAQYAKREEKLVLILNINQKLDHLKCFMTILWEANGLETSKYSQLAQKLSYIGTMVGGWINKMQPPKKETLPI